MVTKATNFFEQMNPVLRFILSLGTILSITITIVLWPINSKIEGLEKRVHEVEREHKKHCDEYDKKLDEKLSQEREILNLTISPMKESIDEIKGDIKDLIRIVRENGRNK